MIKNIIISIVKALISAACGGAIGWLTAHGAVTTVQVEILLGVIAAFVVNLLWSVARHVIVKWKLDAALALPEGSSGTTLREASDAVGSFQKIKEVLRDDVTLPAEESPIIVEDDSEGERTTGPLGPPQEPR